MNYQILTSGTIKTVQLSLLSSAGMVLHGFTCRIGGVSNFPWDKLNLAYHVGDNPEDVTVNRALLCQACGVTPDVLVAADQVHGTNIAIIGLQDAGKGAKGMKDAIPATDALITAEKGILLSAYFADCVPVLVVDPVTPAVCVVHAGRRGTAAGIAVKAVKALVDNFATNPARCLAAIGPSIGPCCYEVEWDAAESFTHYPWFEKVYRPGADEKGYLNLWEANRLQLADAGLAAENIAVAQLCTCCCQDLFFSHRGSGGKTGRLAAYIMLK